MTDYKKTLNLPNTEFPMRANLPNREPVILDKWISDDVYGKLRKLRSGKKKFILHDGPPYANGIIHMGHVLNKTLKDIVVKSKSMSGFDAPFLPGWDCHGLPIELKVEKKEGKPGKKIDHAAFRVACRKYANTQIASQKADFIRLGGFGDWDNSYLSMDYKYEADVIRALAKIVEGGYIAKGNKPVHWCFDCQSSLAEAEVEYDMRESASIDVRFEINSILDLPKTILTKISNLPISVAIWTTTPWSLSANQAVSLHPDFEYVLVKLSIDDKEEILIVVRELVAQLIERWGVLNHEIVGSISSKDLEHVQLKHPFEDRVVPCILSDHVTLETGTGAVHTAPSHGIDDFRVCEKYGLPVINPVGANGCYVDGTPHFAGLHVLKATESVLEVLRDRGNLIFAGRLTHSYPHCWRHKSPVIYRATSQWFVSLDHNGLRKNALEFVKDLQWVPGWGMSRMASMLSDRPDWCISRQQRTWGVPMAFVVHKNTGELHPEIVSMMHKVADIVEKEGIEAWFSMDAKKVLGVDTEEYFKSQDTLDVWFGAGVSHECVLSKEEELSFPADLYLEGSDQHRGWFQSSLLTSIALNVKPPYKAVLTHGYTVDADGKKMSKSIGNFVSPDKLIKNLGADILRLWVASTDYQKDVNISDEILKRTSDAYRRIRNTLRYLLSNLYDFDPETSLVPFDEMLELDKYALNATKELQESIQADYDNYQFHHVFQKIHNFCTVEMGSFYLDIIKDRQYTCGKDSMPRRSCQTAIYHIAHTMVRWIAPILSFTAEEMWGHLVGTKQESVFLTTWYTDIEKVVLDKFDNNFWKFVIQVRDECNKSLEIARNASVIGSPLEAEVTLYCSPSILEQLSRIKKELHFILITSKVDLVPVDDANEITDSDIEGLKIKVEASSHEKCTRCWHRRVDIGQNKEHPELCSRCISNVFENGEVRSIA